MSKVLIILGIILFSPLIFIVILFESTISIPLLIYTFIRLKQKELNREKSTNS